MDPFTASLIASGISNAASGLFGGSSGASAQPQSVFTPEMLQNAWDSMNQYMGAQNALAGTPSYAPGGVTTQQARELSPKEIKTREYANYLVQQKGYTPENAQARANQIAASSKENFKSDKEFSRFVRQGGSSALSKRKGGGIKAQTEFAPGGVNVSPESELMRSAMSNLGLQSLAAATGLPAAYASEEQRALATRQGLANQALNYLGQGIGSSGLFSTQEKALEDMKNKYLNDFSSLYTDTMRRATSDLAGTGFSSSNLAQEYMQDYAAKPQRNFLTDALAKLAGQEQSFLTQASGIGAQNLQNYLGAFNTLGQQQGIGSVLGGILNPAGAGLFTDPTSYAAASNLQQQAIGNRRADQQLMNQINLQPVTLMPEQPGLFSTAMTALSPLAGALAYNQFTKPKAETRVV